MTGDDTKLSPAQRSGVLLTFRKLMDHAGVNAPRLRRSLAGMVLAALMQGLAFACLLPAFSALLASQDAYAAARWTGGMSVLMLAAALLRWQAQAFDFDGHMTAAVHDLRLRIGAQLRRMPLLRVADRRSGEMHATLLGDVDDALGLALTAANLLASALVTPAAAFLCVCLYDVRLGLVLFICFPALFLLYRWQSPALGQARDVLAAAQRRVSAGISEYMQGLQVLRTCRCEGEKAAALRRELANLETLQLEHRRKVGGPNAVTVAVIETACLALLWAGTFMSGGGMEQVAVLAAVSVMLARFSGPMGDAVSYTVLLSIMDSALRQAEDILNAPPLPQLQPHLMPQGHDVSFRNVTFRYQTGGNPALAEFTADFPEGTVTALAGHSGSGKSTVARLLQRHADPQSGSIAIGGTDLRHMPPEALNRLVSVVFQDVHVFGLSLYDNIAMARPSASRAEVERAAGAAQCLDFIARLPEGWETRLGDGGHSLSGGERQRLSIARAILKDAPLLILDEATAALDPESEQAVQTALEWLMRGRTTLVIAHRLHTLRHAHEILVLKHGRLAERGTHDALLASRGAYHGLWHAQAREKSWAAS
ncbi:MULTISPECIES: ABC transporter ATP-binding protein [unclassified Pannonibacter]|uniref:ABC transporter ATP-binding protein n=1 Tax=unclassified Pannonibacter TaxID=2627228 RepID=UPI001AD8F6C8|nr:MULTISPECIES: ABC transporter ATP-binding protein [unclassified Pannonibacter]